MIFHHGFVHCDPHAANMMLRVKPGRIKVTAPPYTVISSLRVHAKTSLFLDQHTLFSVYINCNTLFFLLIFNFNFYSSQLLCSGTTNEPQLILLDHGLYKTLDPELRANYAGLWRVSHASSIL